MESAANYNQKHYVILDNVEVTPEQYKWYHILTDGSEIKQFEFSQIYDQTGRVGTTIIRYRQKLFDEEQDIIDINSMYFLQGHEEDFQHYLEWIFKEPVCLKTVEYYMELNGWDWGSLIDTHLKDKGKRLLSIVMKKRRVSANTQLN